MNNRQNNRRRNPRKRRSPRHATVERVIGPITYPDLPVSQRRDEIKETIANNQVIIIAGETGSGKTTQIPKMCLDLGRGRTQLIGHTQPRRLAARSVAERIAEEMSSSEGTSESVVGYKIRFDDTVSPATAVKLMTDGVLLNEIQRDRLLKAYDTIIIDEAHERSLNIDYLLGYLKQLLSKRPDLKVIITSATIDPESFAQHFADAQGNPAPIIEVSGRTYPVEIRYRPLVTENVHPKTGEIREVEIDPLDGLVDACRELMREGQGDILCFFSGEREIRDAADALEAEFNRRQRGEKVDVLPLFGRLSNAEQHRVFHPSGQQRRIVLATNIAETSLTVPGIHYVIDTGYARISRYSNRTKVQRLPVEPISQASAQQRSGRCGRTADGIAIRLYSEEDFESRPEFTDPEILRTHLASVILSMTALDLGNIEDFPFIQPPDRRAIRDGIALLQELTALSPDKQPVLTDVGRQLACIPTDPRLARMLEQAHRLGVLEHIAVVVAALSIQDVRERPMEKQAQADELHARFAGNSDFISLLNLWNYLQEKRSTSSGNQFRKLCQKEFIHYMRVREWMDLVRQLLTVVQDLRWSIPNISHVRDLHFAPESIDEDTIHKAILAGLLTQVGMREGNSKQYTGTRNSHFVIHPSSTAVKKPPLWVMAAELVETSQLFARSVGPIRPEWIEDLGSQLVKKVHSEPHWSAKRGAAVANEKVLLLGLPIIADRTVLLGKIDPALARELFIRHALVEGDWHTHHKFYKHNLNLLDQASALEDKARRRDIIVDDQVLFDFYDSKLPDSIISARHFDSWWKKAKHKDPDALNLSLERLIDSKEGAAAADEFPDVWHQGSLEFDLSYVFSPGDPDDGITMRIPLPLLGNVSAEDAQWLVGGMRLELLTALIKSLPKPLRKTVVPAADFAAKALEKMVAFDSSVTESLADALRSLGGSGISAQDFNWSRVPDHLRMQFAAIDRRGKVVAKSRELVELQQQLESQVTSAIAQASARHLSQSNAPTPNDSQLHGEKKARESRQKNNSGNTAKAAGTQTGNVLARAQSWTNEGIGEIPKTVDTVIDGQTVSTYPALVHSSDGIELKAFPSETTAAAQQFRFVLVAMTEVCVVSPQQMLKGLPLRQRVALESGVSGGFEALLTDLVTLGCKDLLMQSGPVIRTPEKFAEIVDTARLRGPSVVRRYVVDVAPAILAVADMRAELKDWEGDAIDDMREQLDFFAGPHAIARNGIQAMKHVPRYVAAIASRLELLDKDPDKEADFDDHVREAKAALQATLQRLPSSRAQSPQIKEVRWMIEEFRVSLFAQQLGTTRTVSLPRIKKALAKIR